MICGKIQHINTILTFRECSTMDITYVLSRIIRCILSEGSEFAHEDVSAGSAILSSGVVVSVDGTKLSSVVVVGGMALGEQALSWMSSFVLQKS
jgi:hypothetical protein